jgi:O-antigen biosynthesis protein
MKILTLIKIFLIALSTPIKTAKKFSFKKVKVLIRALNNEPSQQIISNFQRYLLGETDSQLTEIETVKTISIKDEIVLQKKELFNEFIHSGSFLVFPRQKPDLSIILVLFNKAELSLACLESILKNVNVAYELIIVDNNSTDETTLLLDRIQGATIIRNKENLHFLRANNQALEFVKGKYLLFLNNDTEIAETTIRSAFETLTCNEKCGAVGGKLILPGGSLQEAGSIIWSDGSCLGYGRNENPGAPEYNFKRIADYCSGAFLLTKTSLFKEHSGFDTCFEPAYYEETDYCLWLQEKGLQVIYDPNAVVFHFEFGSGIHDSAILLHQKNQQIFYRKHQKQLQKHYKPDLSNVLKARFAATQKRRKKVLYIDDRVPHIDLGSGFPRSNIIVKFIRELGFDITIYPLNFPNEDNWDTAFRDINPFIEIALGYGREGFDKYIHSREKYFDIIWISRPHNIEEIGKKIQFLKGKSRIIYDAEALFADREIHKNKLDGKMITGQKKNSMYINEIRLSDFADVTTTVSHEDALKFKKFGKNDVHILGHTLECKKLPLEFNERQGLLFVGNLDYDSSPNVDSIVWFINEILPTIKKNIPDIEVEIIGSANSIKVHKINKECVFIRGRVESVEEYYNKSRIFIAPTRFAAGIPFKIHEAASYGLPVVATQLLCDQLGWHNKKEIITAKIDAFDFAQKVIRLYNDDKLWNTIQKNALNFVKDEMSPSAYKQKISEILKG